MTYRGPTKALWPEPYRAAFAVSTDIDQTTPELFDTVRRFFTTREDTSYGPGLGWEHFADSFFGSVANPAGKHQLRVFEDVDRLELSECAPQIGDAIKAEAIDCLHAWGDYIGVGGFKREHAEALVAWMRENDLQVPLWVNHGDGNNQQNLAIPTGHGDDPDASEFNLDLVQEIGVRFYWLHELSPVASHGIATSPGQRLVPLNPKSPSSARLRPLARVAASLYQLSGMPLWLKVCHRLGWYYSKDEPLLRRVTLRDGSEVMTFRRYGAWDCDSLETGHHVLTERAMNQLVKQGGAMVFYTHAGKAPPSEQTLASLRYIDKLYRDGLLWITSVPKLLDHYVNNAPEGAIPSCRWDQIPLS